MTAVRVDLHIEQGSDWPGLAFPIFDEEGQPYDLTGCTARGQIRRLPRADADLYFTWSTSPQAGEGLLSFSSNSLVVRVLATESAPWAFTEGVYDLELTNPAAPLGKRTFRVAQGAVFVDPEVTRS